MLTRTFDLGVVKRKLLFKQGAVMTVTSSTNVQTDLDMAELAALNNIAAADLAKIDGITNGTGAAGKALVLDASSDITSGVRNFTGLTLVDTTSIEVTNIKAKDATASIAIADSTGVVTHSKKVVFVTATNGSLHGAGASGANHSLGATALNAMEYYLDATHTTGDMRGLYLRQYFSGAGGSGEAARIFGTINNVSVATGGTVNGAHISLGTAGASAAVSGAANALRATFGIAAASTAVGGTCAVIQVDTDFTNGMNMPSNFAFLRFTNSGTSATVPLALMRVPNVAAATNGLFCVHTTDAMTHSLRFVSEGGTEYHIMCTTTTSNRTEA